MPITALPTPPSRNDPTNFAERGDAFLASLPTFVTEANALEINVNAKEASATLAAQTATIKEGEATASATASGQHRQAAEEAAVSAGNSAGAAATSEANAAGSASQAAASAASIDPATIVRNTGNQTIAGVKTFQNGIVTPSINGHAVGGTINRLINGGAEVAQRAAPSLSTAAQYGQVDRCAIWASGGAVSAGTIAQNTAATVGRTGKAARAAGVTLTGAGVISWRYRMDAADAVKLKNQTGSFQIAVMHDVGSNVNYTIIIRKPTAADNFAATTVINTGAATAVATGTATVLKSEGVALGDCSNGLEIEVQAACGAVTTKNFDFTEWQLEEGAIATTFDRKLYAPEYEVCRRYARPLIGIAVGQCFAADSGACFYELDEIMRATPSLSTTAGFTITTAGGGTVAATPAVASLLTNVLRINFTGASGLVAGNVTLMTPPNGIILSAEL